MPANYTERRTFLDDFTADFDSLFSLFDFLVGDWNMVPDPLIDRVTTATSNTQTLTMWSHLAPCLRTFFDAALAGASSHFFTYEKESETHCCQSRIDHVFAHSRYATLSFETTLYEFPRSDHRAILVHFSTPSSSSFSTPLLYRLNTSLLSSDDLRSRTLACFRPYRSSFSWEATKTLSRSYARDFAYLAARRRRSNIQILERQLAQARHASARDIGNDALATLVISLRDQLDSAVTVGTSWAVFWTWVQWFEEGKTCSSYFFSRFHS